MRAEVLAQDLMRTTIPVIVEVCVCDCQLMQEAGESVSSQRAGHGCVVLIVATDCRVGDVKVLKKIGVQYHTPRHMWASE